MQIVFNGQLTYKSEGKVAPIRAMKICKRAWSYSCTNL